MKIGQPCDLLLKKLFFIYELRVYLQIFGSTGPNPDSANNCFVQGGTWISSYTEETPMEITK